MAQHKLKLWVKWKPEHQQSERGTMVLKSGPHNDREAERAITRFKRLLNTRYRGRYWQARIYDANTNQLLYHEQTPYETSHTQAG